MGLEKCANPFVVPRTDGKLIEEFVGIPSTKSAGISIAHMVAPPGWTEPTQVPLFDEYTIMISGRQRIEADGEVMDAGAGDVIKVSAHSRVTYSNPFAEPAEYWAICLPAFSLGLAGRVDSET